MVEALAGLASLGLALVLLVLDVPKLIFELALARADGSYLKTLEKLAKVELLVLDDWSLAQVEGQAAKDLMDVVDDRAGVRSTMPFALGQGRARGVPQVVT